MKQHIQSTENICCAKQSAYSALSACQNTTYSCFVIGGVRIEDTYADYKRVAELAQKKVTKTGQGFLSILARRCETKHPLTAYR